MEYAQPDPNASCDRFNFEEFLKVFQSYLLICSKQDKNRECLAATTTPGDQSSTHTIKDLLIQLCTFVSRTLQELFNTTAGEPIDPKTNKYDDTEDILEALLLVVTAVRTSPYNLICCPKHNKQLMSLPEWPETLMPKLVQYLVPRTASESKLDRLLMRLLEVILNPPKDFGPSKAWLLLAREIETKLVLEDADVCKFLSHIFVLLSPQAKARISVSVLDYLKQILYDDDTVDLVSNEMLNLVYILSFDPKVQKSLIEDEFQQRLLSWLIDSIDTETGLCKENLVERNNIITSILINLFQSCEKSDMREFLSCILTKGLTRNPRDIMLKGSSKIVSDLLSPAEFNSFVPVCVHFGNELGKHSTSNKVKEVQKEGFFKGLNGLNLQHKQKLLNHIQKSQPEYKHLRLLESFDFQLKSVDLKKLSLLKQLPKIITFQYRLNEKLVTLGVFMKSEFTRSAESLFAKSSSPSDFLFCCIEDEDISIIEIDFTVDMGYKDYWNSIYVNPKKDYAFGSTKVTWSISIHSNVSFGKAESIVDYDHSSNLEVNHLILAKYSKAYGSRIYDKHYDYQQKYEPVGAWTGAPFLNFNKLVHHHGIYNDSGVTTNVNDIFELYRPGNRIIYMPKEMTVKEMLDVLYKGNENIARTVQVHYQQNIVSPDVKILDIDATIRDQTQFQILDLTLGSPINKDIKNPMLSAQAFYQNILMQHSTKLQKPLANYLINNGGPLDFLKTVSLENMNETATFKLMEVYKKIIEIIGPFLDMLSSIMKEDLVILLWHVLFSGCTDEKALRRLLYVPILRSLMYSNVLASDIKELYHFLETSFESLLDNPETNMQSPGLYLEVKNMLLTFLSVELLQNPKYLRGLIKGVLEGDEKFDRNVVFTTDDYIQNCNFGKRTEELLTRGMNLAAKYCSDHKFNNNYVRVSQAALIFAKTSGYLCALEQDENFESNLLSLLTIFEDIRDSNVSIGEANNKMEFSLLGLMKGVYGKMAELMHHKRDLVTENNLADVSKACCGVFDFVQNELKKLEKEQDRFSSFDIVLDILNSANIIFKKLVDGNAMCRLGVDAANQFYYQYLSGMEEMGTAFTIAKIVRLLNLISDENLFIGILVPIFELLNLWSLHPVLSKLLEHEVDGGMLLSKSCLEFAKVAEGDLKGEESDGPVSPLKKENKELKVKARKLLAEFKKRKFEK